MPIPSAAYLEVSTPVGRLWVAHDDGVVCLSLLGGAEDAFLELARRRLRRSLCRDPSPPAGLVAAIRGRLDGNAPLAFLLNGETRFRRAVLAAVGAIPRGEVRTYAQVAAAVGRPRAARAVGEVMRTNPIPVLIPCHRVVRTGGDVGNYTPDPELKRRLLEWEGALQVTGYRLQVTGDRWQQLPAVCNGWAGQPWRRRQDRPAQRQRLLAAAGEVAEHMLELAAYAGLC